MSIQNTTQHITPFSTSTHKISNSIYTLESTYRIKILLSLSELEVSYAHKCRKCKRIICTFPSCAVLLKKHVPSYFILARHAVVFRNTPKKERARRERQGILLIESSRKTKNSKQKSTISDVRKIYSGTGTDKQKL